jgi:hypothetical protein
MNDTARRLELRLSYIERVLQELNSGTAAPEHLERLRLAAVHLTDFGDQNNAFYGLGAPKVDTVEDGWKIPEAVSHPKTAATNEALKWGMIADACDAAGRELLKLANEVDAERKSAGAEKDEIQKIFTAIKKSQLEIDHAVILANTLATKFRKAR